MKNEAIRKPARVAERSEIAVRLTAVIIGFPNNFLYPIVQVSKSNTTLAAVKARKWIPPGLRLKLITVAMRPTTVAAPGLRIHQTVRINVKNPIRSHRKGMPVIAKKIGEKMAFSTPHRAAQSDIAAKSRLLK